MLKLEHLQRAFEGARKCVREEGMLDKDFHRKLSQKWVECLAEELKNLFSDQTDIATFYRSNKVNQLDFLLNELLYDVCICRTAESLSPSQGVPLRYVTKALWQIESEFKCDFRELFKDFSKLVIGSAENKLFVGPQTTLDDKEYLKALLPVARCCTGNVYVASVPHPEMWKKGPTNVSLWKLVEDFQQQL